MESRIRLINKYIKMMDSKLYAERSGDFIHILREGYEWTKFDYNGYNFSYPRYKPRMIMSLTDNWTESGKPVDWGIEPICQRLRDIDGWNRQDLYEQLEKSQIEAQESKDKDRKNAVEAKLYDVAGQLAKSTKDYNVSLMK